MFDFWQAALTHPLARNALFAALLVSLCCGTVGTYVNRIYEKLQVSCHREMVAWSKGGG